MFSCHSECASHESCSQLQGFCSLRVLTRAIHSFDCLWAELCLCEWLTKLCKMLYVGGIAACLCDFILTRCVWDRILNHSFTFSYSFQESGVILIQLCERDCLFLTGWSESVQSWGLLKQPAPLSQSDLCMLLYLSHTDLGSFVPLAMTGRQLLSSSLPILITGWNGVNWLERFCYFLWVKELTPRELISQYSLCLCMQCVCVRSILCNGVLDKMTI